MRFESDPSALLKDVQKARSEVGGLSSEIRKASDVSFTADTSDVQRAASKAEASVDEYHSTARGAKNVAFSADASGVEKAASKGEGAVGKLRSAAGKQINLTANSRMVQRASNNAKSAVSGARSAAEKVFNLRGDASDVEKASSRASTSIRGIENREIQISGNSAEAVSASSKASSAIGGIKDRVVGISANAKAAITGADRADSAVRGINNRDVQITGNPSSVEKASNNASSALRGVEDRNVTIAASAKSAVSEANRATDAVNQVQDKTITLKAEAGGVISEATRAQNAVEDARSSAASPIRLKADSSQAESEAKNVGSAIGRVRDRARKAIGLKVSADTGGIDEAQSKTNTLRRMDGSTVGMDVEVDTAQVDEAESKLGGLKTAAIGAASGVAGAGIFSSVSSGATTAESGAKVLGAQLGITQKKARELGGVAQDVFKNAFGESMSDAREGVGLVAQRIGSLANNGKDDIQSLTESAFTLRDLFGFEIADSVSTVKTLTSNFGITGERAFDIITKASQKGGNFADDLLDTFKEYSPQFSQLGLDADQFAGILVKGAKAGAFNMDKVGDAVKEFQVRAQDGSDTTKEGFQTIGLNAEKMAGQIAQGGPAAEKAFTATLAGLASIEDPVKRNQAGVKLLGTMYEDIGPTVVASMAEGAKGMSNIKGATKKAGDTLYDTFTVRVQEAKRSLQVLGIRGLSALLTKLEPVSDALGQFGRYMGEVARSGDVLNDKLSKIPEPLQDIAVSFGETYNEVKDFASNFTPIGGEIMAGLGRGIANGASILVTSGLDAVRGLINSIEDFLQISSPSKKAQSIGGMFVKGFAKGLKLTGYGLLAAVGVTLVAALVEAINTGNSAKEAGGKWIDGFLAELKGAKIEKAEFFGGSLKDAAGNAQGSSGRRTEMTINGEDVKNMKEAEESASLLQKALGMVANVIGAVLSPVLKPLRALFGGVIDSFKSLTTGMLAPNKAIGDIIMGFKAMQPILKPLGALLKGILIGAFEALVPVLGAVLAAFRLGAIAFRKFGELIGWVGKKLQPYQGTIENIGKVIGFVFGTVVIGAIGGVVAVFGKLLTAIARGIKGFKPLINRVDSLGKVYKTGLGPLENFGRAIGNFISKFPILGKMFGVVADAAGLLFRALGGGIQILGKVFNLVFKFIGNIPRMVSGLFKFGGRIKSFFGSLPGTISKQIAKLPTSVQRVLGKVKDVFVAAFTGLRSLVTAAIGRLITGAAVKLKGFITAVRGVFNKLPAPIQTALKIVDGAIDIFFVRPLQALVKIVRAVWNPITQIFQKAFNVISTKIAAWNKVLDDIADATKTVGQRIKKFLIDAFGDIRGFLSRIAIQIVQTVLQSDIAQGIIKYFKGMFQVITGVLTLNGKQIVKGVKNMVTGVIQAAKGIVVGIATAFKNSGKLVGQAVAFLGKAIINGFKRLLGIASPSKVFMRFGRMIILGLSNALRAGARLVRKAIMAPINAVKNVVQSAWNWIVRKTKGTFLEGIVSAITRGMARIKNTVQSQIAIVQAVIGRAWKIIRVTTQRVWTGIKQVLSGAWKVIKGIFTGNTKLIQQGVRQAWVGIRVATKSIWLGIKALFLTVWAGIKAIFGKQLKAVRNVVVGAWNFVKKQTSRVWNGIKAFFAEFWAREKRGWTKIINVLKSIVFGAWTAISNTTTRVWNGIKAFFKKWWGIISRMFTGDSKTVNRIVFGAWNAIDKFTTRIWNAISSFFTKWWNKLKTFITNTAKALGKNIADRWKRMKQTVITIWNSIEAFFTKWWNRVTTWIVNKALSFGKSIADRWKGMRQTVRNVWNSIEVFFTKWWNRVVEWVVNKALAFGRSIAERWKGMRATVRNVWNSIETFFRKWWNRVVSWIIGKALSLGKAIADRWKGMRDTANRLWTSIKEGIQSRFRKMKKWIITTAGKLGRAIADRWKGMRDTAGRIWKSLANKIISMLEGGVNGAIKLINKLGSAINAVAKVIGIDIKVGKIDEITIPRMAKGGIANAPGRKQERGQGGIYDRPTAIMGEAGEEGVMPFKKATKGGHEAIAKGAPIYGYEKKDKDLRVPPEPREAQLRRWDKNKQYAPPDLNAGGTGLGYAAVDRKNRQQDYSGIGRTRYRNEMRNAFSVFNALGAVDISDYSTNSGGKNNSVELGILDESVPGGRAFFRSSGRGSQTGTIHMPTNSQTPSKMDIVATHEVGHSLGMAHNQISGSIMQNDSALYDRGHAGLSAHDKNVIYDIWGKSSPSKSGGGGDKSSKPPSKYGNLKGRVHDGGAGAGQYGPTKNSLWTSDTFGRVIDVLKRYKVSANTYANHPPALPHLAGQSADFWDYEGRGTPISNTMARQVRDYVVNNLNEGLSWTLGEGDAGHTGSERHVHATWKGAGPSTPNVKYKGGTGKSGGGGSNWLSEAVSLFNRFKGMLGNFGSLDAPGVAGDMIRGAGGGLQKKAVGNIKDRIWEWAKNKFVGGGSLVGTNASQKEFANAMANESESRGMPGVLPVMTSWVESKLKNLQGGHADSAGLFQQRPSQGWGTHAQVTNPSYAINKFLERAKPLEGRYGGKGADRYQLGNWAQAVQRSQYPGKYANEGYDAARRILGSDLGKMSGSGGKGGALAGGGLITKDSIFRAGEGGNKEAVFPLENRSAQKTIREGIGINEINSKLDTSKIESYNRVQIHEARMLRQDNKELLVEMRKQSRKMEVQREENEQLRMSVNNLNQNLVRGNSELVGELKENPQKISNALGIKIERDVEGRISTMKKSLNNYRNFGRDIN